MPVERALPNGHLRIFVATRAEDVPPGCTRTISVDGTVPGFALRWDHHTTGERVNLDAMPETFDAAGYDSIATTLADTDAAVSVVVTLLGGQGLLPAGVMAVLRSASHWCDHLRAHPELPEESNARGRRLEAWVSERLSVPADQASEAFAAVCTELASRIARGEPLPEAEPASAALPEERIRRVGRVAVFDERGLEAGAPIERYRQVEQPIGVFLHDHPRGGLQVVVGVNPLVDGAPGDLRAARAALAAMEFSHGPPALGPEPVPGNENWGGRETVFGSPWNYGSRLTVDEIVAAIEGALPRG